MDIIFENVKMYDGTGKNPGKICDVGIEGDKIKAIGNLKEATAEKRIDCTGLSMMPGMIDVHTHTDFAMFTNPQREMAVMQGVTTEITSACGIGAIPLKGKILDDYISLLEALIGKVPEGANTESVDAYFNSLPKTGVNVAVQIAHSPLRAAATQTMCDCVLDDDAWKRFEKLEREAFDMGAVSVSTGMSYFPAAFSDTAELIKIAKVATDYNAPFSVHRRDSQRNYDPNFNSTQEVVTVAREANAKMVLSHYRTGPWNPGHHEEVCAPIEQAIAEGLQVSADFYPYDNGCTYGPANLPFSFIVDGPEGMKKILNDPEQYEKFVQHWEAAFNGRMNGVYTYLPKHPEYLGRSFIDCAKETGEKSERMFVRLMRDEDLHVANIGGVEASKEVNDILCDDFAYFLTKPYYVVGSDTIPCHPFTHPRSYGAFAKVMKIARDHDIDFSILANRVAGSSAELYQIKNRGFIKEGYFADLAIFDEKTVEPKSSYENPKQFPIGMKYVCVNGQLEVENGQLTGVRAGRPVRRGK